MKDLPKKIYLQVGDEADSFDELHEVTWCADQIEDSDVGYLIEELPPPKKQEKGGEG